MSGGAREAVGVFTTDRALVVRTWDPWLAEATGLSEEAACGRALGDLFPELAERGLLARLRRVAEEGVPELLAPAFHHYLLPCPPREPSAHFARMQQHVTISPLRTGAQVVGVVVTIEDVTPRLDRERELAAQLRSHDESIRLRAARQLAEAERPAPSLSPALSDALGDASWKVRRAAAEGLARGEDAVALLLHAIRERHRDPAVLNAAISGLVQSEHDVVPSMVELLASDDAEVRTYAALALGHLGDPRAVPAVERLLDDADPNVRFHAIEALGRIGDHRAAERLLAVAESRDFFLAFPALDALALVGEPSVAPRLVALLDDALLRDAVIGALGRLGGEDVVPPIARLLEAPGAPAVEIAGALATLYRRLDEGFGEGTLVADLLRRVAGAGAARALVEALPAADDAALASLTLVLGWLDFAGVDRVLARLLAHAAARPAAAEALARRGAAAVEALEEALGADDDEVRKAAAATLGRIGSARVVPALLALLDGPPEVAIVAAGALGAIGDRRAFEPLLSLFDRPEAAVRHSAVAALNSIGHPEMPARVRERLADPSPWVREAAARVAGYFGYDDCLEPLLRLCAEGEDATVRRTAVEQLAHFDDPRAFAALRAALGAAAPAVRAAAARTLAQADPAAALPLLDAAAHDPDPWVRYYAARSAGHLGAPEAVPMLVELALGAAMPPVRIAAAEALGEIGAAEGVAALERLAGDPTPDVRMAALRALGRIPVEAAVPPLLAALRVEEHEALLAALDALAARAEGEAVPEVRRLARAAQEPRVRARAVEALGRIGSAGAVDALLALASEPRRRAEVTAALARAGAAHVDAVARGLAHPDAGVRCAVVEALARMKHHTASRLLAGALGDAAPAVRLAAAQALGRLDLQGAESRLSTIALTDESMAVRRAARDALTR